ncbi:MAG: class I SAM-dependent methyltransferase [Bacteroidales bacterium]|nr:class I SAM-dependent methyltransferase [Bacteroidales bacterium]
MKTKCINNFLLILLSFSLLPVSLTCQAQQGNEDYEPRVGQAGKDVVWVPTPQALVDKMLEIAEVTPQDYVIDLGSGDGRTVITAAKLGARATGIEYNPDMVALSKKNAISAGVGNKTEFIQADLFETDLSQATVITMFLLPDINLRLRPRILDLKPGTRIVSNTFTMQDWEADMTVRLEEDCTSWCTALLWIVPAKVDGTWRLGNGELELTQEFQMLRGTLTFEGTEITLTDGKLRGVEITFNADGAIYAGSVNGNTMTGTIQADGNVYKWSATRISN